MQLTGQGRNLINLAKTESTYFQLASKSIMDGTEYQYSSSEEEKLDVDDEIVIKNKRGKGKEWYPVRTHASMLIATRSVDSAFRKKGRTNRGRTMAVYYHCRFKSCGCKMEWRLVSEVFSYAVVEEETVGFHTCHDLLQRNGGRGLSFDQVQMLDTAYRLGIKKPASIVKYFENIAREIYDEGKIKYT